MDKSTWQIIGVGTAAYVGYSYLKKKSPTPSPSSDPLAGLFDFLTGVVDNVFDSVPPQLTPDNLRDDVWQKQKDINQVVSDAKYAQAVAVSRQARNIPVSGGSYRTPTSAGNIGAVGSLSRVYNADFRVAGADTAAPYNVGALVAPTIGGSSQGDWYTNLRSKGMNQADAERISDWHASRGETITG